MVDVTILAILGCQSKIEDRMSTSRSLNSLDTPIIRNQPPNMMTDLTTLTGRSNEYKNMVETLFTTEFGNLKVGDILLTSQDEFLNEYGQSPQMKSLLRGWIAQYNLGDSFAENQSGKFDCFILVILVGESSGQIFT